MPSWPSFLSDKLLIDSLRIQEESNRITSAGDVGEPMERRRSTATGAFYNTTFKLSRSHLQLFRDWWYDETKFGLISFDWQDPFSLITYSFKATSEPRYTPFATGWTVDLELYCFPGFKPGDIIQTIGVGSLLFPMLTVAGEGEQSDDAIGAGDLVLPMVDVAAVGTRLITVTGTSAVELPMLDLYASENTVNFGYGAVDLPMLTADADGLEEIEGSGALAMPMMTVDGDGDVGSLAVYLDQIISDLGLTSNLALVLDAADGSSYGGSGQQWSDVSGSGNHFNRGSGSGSDSYDPTFNGTANAGTQSEYFSSDGSGDHFSPTGSPTFDDGWHKNNGKFTALGMMYLPSHGGTTRTYFPLSNRDSGASSIGTTIRVRQRIGTFGNETILEALFSNGSTEIDFGEVAFGLVENTWVFWAVSHDESGGASGSFFRIMNVVSTHDGAIASPSSSNPAFSPKVGAQGGYPASGVGMNVAGTRVGCIAAWNTDLTQSQVTSIYNALKVRYPTLP